MCLCSIDYCDFAANKFIPCISGEVLPNFSEFNIMQCNSGLIIILKMIQSHTCTETLQWKEYMRR
jgi:hypothetical protein